MTRPFGRAPDGLPATLHRLSTPSGRIAEVCDWGGIVHRLDVPGPGGLHPLLLSLPSVEAHAADPHYIGVLIGRVANRIAGGRVPALGLTLPVNHGAHHLHGGPQGLHAQRFVVQRLHEGALRLHHHSPDGAGGYPGTLDLSVVIALSDIDGLSFSWAATTSAPTLFSPTFHGYWDLSATGDLNGHALKVRADRLIEVDPDMQVIGPAPVRGPLDLRRGPPLRGGIDHCFILDEPGRVATLRHPASPIALEVETDRPGMQVYTANFLHTTLHNGEARGPHSAVCLETGPWPDAPNQPGFPSIRLDPGRVFRSQTTYRLIRT